MASLTPAGSNAYQVRLATVPGQTFGTAPQLAFLSFTALQPIRFCAAGSARTASRNADGSTPTNIVPQAGRIVIVGAQPLVEAIVATNHARSLDLYGVPGDSYALQLSTDLVHWSNAFRVPMTNISAHFTNINPTLSPLFYRADQFVTLPPIVDILPAPVNGHEQLVLYGTRGSAYQIEYTSDLGAPWSLLARIALTNDFQFITGLNANSSALFYRFNLLIADPPILEASLNASTRALLAYGVAGTNYTLQYATNLAGPAAWHTYTNYTLTNAFRSFTNLDNSTIFYRLQRH